MCWRSRQQENFDAILRRDEKKSASGVLRRGLA
jgi:hypothetical protein